MVEKSYRLDIMAAAGKTVVEVVTRAPGWIALAWLPWLVGTAVYIAVAVLWTLLQNQPARTRNLELSCSVGLVTVVLIYTRIADLAVDQAERTLFASYVADTIQNHTTMSPKYSALLTYL